MAKDEKAGKDDDSDGMLKSRFSASRLRDIVLGLKDPRRDLIIARGWGVLLDIGAFSAPKGLLEWILLKIDAELGEFRNTRNNTHIVFNKEMVVKALGLPRGTRPLVLTGDHEESPYREFYRIHYKKAGRRAPIYIAEKMLEDDALDEETWFRTFFLVVIGTYFFPGTSIMLPLEYLGSLGDSKLVSEYDWVEQIFRHTMSEIKSFQEKWRKAAKDGTNKPVWVGGSLPWVAMVYMDHLDFPVSTLSSHRINYAIPRASHISDADFKFVMKHDRSRLTLSTHTYGARPFRPFNATPYAIVNTNLENQAYQGHNLPHHDAANSSHLGQETPRQALQGHNLPQDVAAQSSHLGHIRLEPHFQEAPQPPRSQTNISTEEDLLGYMKTIYDKHTSLWLKDVEMLTTIHHKRMNEFASEVFAAFKNKATSPDGLSLPPAAPTPFASPPTTTAPITSSPRQEEPAFREDDGNISDPKQTPNTQFWEIASRLADEVEQSAGKTSNRKDPSSSTHACTKDASNTETARLTMADILPPTFDLLSQGNTLTQYLGANNEPSPQSGANVSSSVGRAPIDTSVSSGADLAAGLPSTAKNDASKAPTTDVGKPASSVNTFSQQPPVLDVVCTVGTQTQDKKNRKKRVFLGLNNDANQKKLKNLKVTDESKEVYDTYILRRCIRPPVDGEASRFWPNQEMGRN